MGAVESAADPDHLEALASAAEALRDLVRLDDAPAYVESAVEQAVDFFPITGSALVGVDTCQNSPRFRRDDIGWLI